MSVARMPREPSPEHPITIGPEPARVTVRVGDTVVADSTATLRMHEARYAPVHYVPLEDVDQALLSPSETTSYCPYKGDAGYYSLSTPDGDVHDAVWFYESPYTAVGQIAGHVAFYADRVSLSVGVRDAAEVG